MKELAHTAVAAGKSEIYRVPRDELMLPLKSKGNLEVEFLPPQETSIFLGLQLSDEVHSHYGRSSAFSSLLV